MRFDTRLIHSTTSSAIASGDVVAPIHLSTTYEQFSQPDLRYFYGRGENPTREALEACLASLEDAHHAVAYSSGQAAGAAVLSLLPPGSTVISSEDVYGGTHLLFEIYRSQGINISYNDFSNADDLAELIKSTEATMLWIETPTNPLLQLTDISAISQACSGRNMIVVVDNTFAGPVIQQPLALGADISLYSTTKSIAGHGDVIGGALVLNDASLAERLRKYRTGAGNVPGAFDCYLVHRGVKTMSLRVNRQCESAATIAKFLSESDRVSQLYFPGNRSAADQSLMRKQMQAPGSIISFKYRGDAQKLLAATKLFRVAVSLGSVHSLIECPATMTHRPVPQETRDRLGITDDLIRLSIGIEDVQDLLEDLHSALRAG